MKKFKALATFSGVISMVADEERMLNEASHHVKTLVGAKLIQEVPEEEEKPKAKKATKKKPEKAKE